MHSSSTTQRKNKPPQPKATSVSNNNTSIELSPLSPTNGSNPPLVATVYRRKCGTGPFDERWLNLDCCGLFCAVLTYSLHLYGIFSFCVILIPSWMNYTDGDGVRKMSLWGQFHCLAFSSVAILAIYAHYRAMTTDPGAVPPDASPITELDAKQESTTALQQPVNETIPPLPPSFSKPKRICRRCSAFKPARAHHCSICRRCIIKMDHHCPWINNCVGISNHKFFLLFIFYTFLSCSYSSTMIFMRFFQCVVASNDDMGHRGKCLDNPTHMLYLVGLMVEAMLFGLFTTCMMVDQWDVVMTKITHIDRLKNERFGAEPNNNAFDLNPSRSNKPTSSGINEVFGVSMRRTADTGFRLDWLSPLGKATFPAHVRDEIMGFCRPCACVGTGHGDLELGGLKKGGVETV